MLLKKVVSLAVPGMIAVAAFLHAQAVGALVDATAMPKSIAPFAEARAAERDEPAPARSAADALLAHDVFDHTAVHAPPLARSSVDAPAILTADAPPCEGVRTILTVRAPTPDASFAALDVGGKRHFGRRGATVEGLDIVHVGADRVWMRQSGTVCQSLVFADPPAAKQEAPKPAGSALEQELGKQIQQTGPTSWAIDRGAVSRIIEAQAELVKVPVAPEQVDGKLVGYRLVRIKPGSILALLGLQSGDRLESLDGISVTSPEGMMQAYARLGTLERLSITIARGGKPLTLDYAVK